jgi:hypothetical protein
VNVQQLVAATESRRQSPMLYAAALARLRRDLLPRYPAAAVMAATASATPAQLAALRIDDLAADGGAVTVGGDTYASPVGADILRAYRHSRIAEGAAGADPLFIKLESPGRRKAPEPAGTQSLHQALQRVAREAGLPLLGEWTPRREPSAASGARRAGIKGRTARRDRGFTRDRTESQPDDRKVEAALDQSARRLERSDIARAFGWDISRTSQALAGLAARLASTGQLLHYNQSAGGYALRGRDDLLHEGEQHALARSGLARTRLTLRQARLLRQVMNDDAEASWGRSSSGADQARLQKLGMVRLEYGHPVLTEAASYSLDVAAKARNR